MLPNAETQLFAYQNTHLDTLQLALQAHLYPHIDIKSAIQQIKGLQKAKQKLPQWFDNQSVIYPQTLSIEQCSSELAAQCKIDFLQTLTPKAPQIIDMTGGFGVDTFFFSKIFEKVIYLEQQHELFTVTSHNFSVLGAKNIASYNQNSVEFLKNIAANNNYIYIDPARRSENNQKLVSLADCAPNVLEIMPLLRAKSQKILIKTSPILDISKAIQQFKNLQVNLTHVIVVAVDNECKEVLYCIDNQGDINNNTDIHFQTFNLSYKKTTQIFNFYAPEEDDAVVQYHQPLKYLYEPNVAVLKSGAFKQVANHFNLYKLHSNSHLYTSEELIKEFTGRIFEVITICKFDKKEIAKHIPNLKANVTIRNFPLTVEEFRKKTGLKDGGELYLFVTTDLQNNKIVIITKFAITVEM
jgi:precorrin-6B methylase 2